MKLHPKASREVLFCSVGLIVGFLLPWFQLFGFGVSGYQLARLGSYGNYAWVIPILAVLVILQSFSGDNRFLGGLAGLIPLGAIFYSLTRVNNEGGSQAFEGVVEVAKQVLSIGAYVTIGASLAIILAAVRRPSTKPQEQPTPAA